MSAALLNVGGVSAGTEDKPILHGIDLTVGEGECHVLMGPNGAGKSTLGHVIMGDPTYRVTGGSIVFDGADLTDASADKRSLAGIFLSYQAPVEVPGVPLYSFLRTICQMRPELKTTARKFRQRVGDIADALDLDQSFLMRELNVGFSGGEKKKIEMLQLLLLQPKLAILDETDSGLDVDALGVVSRGIEAYREQCDGALTRDHTQHPHPRAPRGRPHPRDGQGPHGRRGPRLPHRRHRQERLRALRAPGRRAGHHGQRARSP